MKKFFQEFKEFINKGNVLGLAVGVIIGGAFSTITTSLTNDIIMPIVSIFLGGVDFSKMSVQLPSPFAGDPEAPNMLNYGNFISAVINFLILALVVFCIVKAVNGAMEKAKKKEEAAPPPATPEPTAEEKLLTEIRDLLKESRK